MKVIGIDPGYATTGYGIINYDYNRFTVLDYGCIITKPNLKFPERLALIYDKLNLLIETFKPDSMAIEKLFFTTNKKTALDVSQARGVMLLSGFNNNLECYDYTPLQVKQAVVGYGKADKAQVMGMTKRILNLNQMPKYDDTCDALAISICHAHTVSSFNKF